MQNRLILAALLFVVTPCMTAVAKPNFAVEVQPILERSCIRCHGAGKDNGDLRMHTKTDFFKGGVNGAPVIPGEPEKSYLIELVSLPAESGDRMPSKGAPLTAEEVAILVDWVKSGAEFPESVELVDRQPKKQISAAEMARLNKLLDLGDRPTVNEIAAKLDELIDLENQGGNLPLATEINDLAFLRKVYVDLIGRIPRMDEIREYIQMPTGERRVKVVDKLLEDDRFADRWTVFFADMLRIRSNREGGNQFLAYVRRSVSEGKPYDQMVREIISSNGRSSKSPEVGYVLAEEADPMTLAAATTQVFLGVRLACAQCHDHPFDRWSQRHFYEFAGFFGKTTQVENNFTSLKYTTETDKMAILWPPEGKAENSERKPVEPKFPFEFVSYKSKPSYLSRFEKRRAVREEEKDAGPDIDSLLDGVDTLGFVSSNKDSSFDVISDVRKDKSKLDIEGDLYRTSELRRDLAARVTDPRNPYFARAFVNRLWFELVGRGFFEPLDNYSAGLDIKHEKTMEFLSREFVASGFDLRDTIRAIVHTKAYRRGHLEPGLDTATREAAEASFLASPTRRMLSEVLFDSIVVAGHLNEYKWPKGANVKTVTRTERVRIDDEGEMAPATGEPQMAMNGTPTSMMAGDRGQAARAGYNLEAGIEIDFDAVLNKGDVAEELAMMKAQSDMQVEQQRMMAAMREQNRRPAKYTYREITETIDDNPKFGSTMRLQTPANPADFQRVFGQPGRDELGDFRDHSPSMRQALMMLNGRGTHEASRVGSLEPLYPLLADPKPDFAKAMQRLYLETLTRLPNKNEVSEGLALLKSAPTPLEGMADLRWVLLNCHEFKYLP